MKIEPDIFTWQLYLIHWPVAFERRNADELVPLTANDSDEAVLDDDVSIVDTWKGLLAGRQSLSIS